MILAVFLALLKQYQEMLRINMNVYNPCSFLGLLTALAL